MIESKFSQSRRLDGKERTTKVLREEGDENKSGVHESLAAYLSSHGVIRVEKPLRQTPFTIAEVPRVFRASRRLGVQAETFFGENST